MKKHVVAIGGTDIKNRDFWGIDRYVVGLAGKASPKACFLPTASGEPDGYIESFHKTYGALGCVTSCVEFFWRTPDLREALLSQDILYVGGGNTRSMLAVWREWGADVILREAYEAGIVLAGVSAGAICWFDQGLTDSSADRLLALDCLGFVRGSCCPHYDGEVERRPIFTTLVGDGEIAGGYAICDGAALHFVDGQPHRVVSVLPAAKAYHVFQRGEYVAEVNLAEQELL